MYIAPAPKGFEPIDPGSLPTSIKRKDINVMHPEYMAKKELWVNIQCLYEGGLLMRVNATNFLKKRPKEDNAVYTYRLDQFNYENNVGPAIGWYEASMFETEPAVTIKLGDSGDPSAEVKDWYTAFLKDCDHKGTSFVDIYRRVFTNLLLFRKAYVILDMPARDPDNEPATLQQERDMGLLDPYPCVCSPLDVINWGVDDTGSLTWALIYSVTDQQTFLGKPVKIERWYYYDRTTYRVYEARHDMSKDGQSIAPQNPDSMVGNTTSVVSSLDDSDKVVVTLVSAGYHCLAAKGVVPVITHEIREGWWFGNRVYLPALKHLNITAALDWSLFMSALAMPVVCTSVDLQNLTMTEAGFIKLDPGDDYKFAEPSGNSWEWLEKRSHSLREEIWRAMYLVSQSRNTSATAAAASGVSKQQDMQPSHDVLNGLGDCLRAEMQKLLGFVAAARSQVGFREDAALTFDVQGFTFEDSMSVDDIAVIQDLLNMNIPSDAAEKELFVLAVRQAFKDLNPDRLQVIIDEIMAAPDRETREMQSQVNMQKQLGALVVDDPEGMKPQ